VHERCHNNKNQMRGRFGRLKLPDETTRIR